MRVGWIVIVSALYAGMVAGQSQCNVLSQPNLTASDGRCAELSIGEVCALADAVMVERDDQPQTLSTAERVPLNDLSAIRIGQDNTQQWGMARFRLAAYAEDSWTLVRVDGVVFGDVSVRNLAQPTPLQDIIVQPVQGINVRRLPDEAARVLYAAGQDDVIRVAARLEDSTWLQVVSPEGEMGWIRSDALVDDVRRLPIVAADSPLTVDAAPVFTRLQVAATSSDCVTSAVQGGLLLQTPSDAPAVSLTINGLSVTLNGTVWMTSAASDTKTVTTVYALQNDVQITIPQGQITLAEGQAAPFEINMRADVSEVIGGLPRLIAFDGVRLAYLPVYALEDPFYVPIDMSRLLQPRPEGDISPLNGMLATAPCRITTGEGGSNIRAGAGTDYPIQGVMGFRESADVLGRAVGSDGQTWWNIAPYLWISGLTTVTGGDCAAVPTVPVEAPR